MLVVDRSSSIGADNWQRVVEYMQDRVRRTEFSDAAGHQMGIVAYATDSEVVCPLQHNVAGLLACIGGIRYTGGWTNTAQGLKDAGAELGRQSNRSRTRVIEGVRGAGEGGGGREGRCWACVWGCGAPVEMRAYDSATALCVCGGVVQGSCSQLGMTGCGGGGRDALEGKGPRGRPERRLCRRLEEVAKAVGGGDGRLQMPWRLAGGQWLGRGWAPWNGGGGVPPPPTHTPSTAPAHQRLGSANAETTPAGAPAAAADRTQRPTQHAKGRTGDCPGPRKGTATQRNITRGVPPSLPNASLEGGVPHHTPPPPLVPPAPENSGPNYFLRAFSRSNIFSGVFSANEFRPTIFSGANSAPMSLDQQFSSGPSAPLKTQQLRRGGGGWTPPPP